MRSISSQSPLLTLNLDNAAEARWLQRTAQKHGQEELPYARGQGQWPGELPHIQGVVAVQAQEGREELLHIQIDHIMS